MIHSEKQKETQSAWDDLACRDSLAALLDTTSPWNHCRLLTAQKSHTAAWSEAFPIASVGNLLSPDELQPAIALRTGANTFESTECRCGSLLTGWDVMASPALRMRAASPDIQPWTPSSNDHWPALVSPLSLIPLAWQKIEEGLMVWPWTPGKEEGALCGTRQLWTPLQKVTT